eukprot:4977492-Amphidinium_carterae.1
MLATRSLWATLRSSRRVTRHVVHSAMWKKREVLLFLACTYRLLVELFSALTVGGCAAAGGVGLVAIQYAQWIGAEVYATAGSEEKHAFLRPPS